MEGPRNRSESAIEKIKEYGTRKSLFILSGLQDGMISRETAMRRLENSGIYGLFMCGQLSVQEAYDSTSLSESVNYLLAATEFFTRTIEESTILNHGRTESLSSKAKIQLAYLPVYETFFHEQFPSESLAQSVHIKTINTAYDLLREQNNWEREPNEVAGTLGELGVLALLQRLAIREIGTDIYFPSPSTFDQDYRNHSGYTIDGGWDINVYSDIGNGLHHEKRIQVKTSFITRDGIPVTPVQSGIKLVCMNPDLKLENYYDSVPREIIADLVLEQDFPKDSQEYINASRRLDMRTELLLDRLD